MAGMDRTTIAIQLEVSIKTERVNPGCVQNYVMESQA